MLVLHLCDNPGCINPAHLYVGTHKDNTNDMYRRGRACDQRLTRKARGEKQGNAKLTERQVKEIRKILRNNKRGLGTRLSKKYGVHYHTIYDIKRNKTWKHVTAEF